MPIIKIKQIIFYGLPLLRIIHCLHCLIFIALLPFSALTSHMTYDTLLCYIIPNMYKPKFIIYHLSYQVHVFLQSYSVPRHVYRPTCIVDHWLTNNPTGSELPDSQCNQLNQCISRNTLSIGQLSCLCLCLSLYIVWLCTVLTSATTCNACT